MPKQWKLAELPFLVGIPVPCLDNKGKRIPETLMQEWVGKAVVELTVCFGGATPLRAPSRNVVGGRVLHEKDQMLVLSGCPSPKDFLRQRSRITAFAKQMGEAMSQYAVFVLAFASHSFLVIDEQKAT